jgi:hypothetical protein
VSGLSPTTATWLRGTAEVQRQVKLPSNKRQLFGLPKSGVPVAG